MQLQRFRRWCRRCRGQGELAAVSRPACWRWRRWGRGRYVDEDFHLVIGGVARPAPYRLVQWTVNN